MTDTIEGRRDARVVAVTSGGTIPDRGLFGVFMEGEAGTPGRRVGELDEEMVYELRAGMHGDVIILGASSWRVAGHRPRPGHGHAGARRPGQAAVLEGRRGRPADRARPGARRVRRRDRGRPRPRRHGPGRRERSGCATTTTSTSARPRTCSRTSRTSATSTGALPTDRRIVVERFRDELGDWRLTLLTPFGGRVHAPWSLAIEARLARSARHGGPDDLVGRRHRDPAAGGGGQPRRDRGAAVPGAGGRRGPRRRAGRQLRAVREPLPRERGPRAAPARVAGPGTRTPLWQQRQRAADLLAVASRYGSFPILVETYRECLSDVFDLDALRDILGGVASREIAVHGVETPRASPFASSLLFDYVAAYMYEGDAPLAERRAGALTLDRDLLRELLGQEELRELLDPEALADLELSLQALTDERQATTVDQVHDLLRRLGDLSNEEVAARVVEDRATADAWLGELAGDATGRPGPDRRARTAGSRSRTWRATAMASA